MIERGKDEALVQCLALLCVLRPECLKALQFVWSGMRQCYINLYGRITAQVVESSSMHTYNSVAYNSMYNSYGIKNRYKTHNSSLC